VQRYTRRLERDLALAEIHSALFLELRSNIKDMKPTLSKKTGTLVLLSG